MKIIAFVILIYLGIPSALLSQTGSITNIQVSQRTDGSGYVDIYYNLQGAASTYYISMEASFNNGTTFSPIALTYLSGSIGAVAPGSNRHIIWNGKGSNNNTYSAQSRIKLNVNIIGACGQPFIDSRDGKTYNTVQIGTQCWMAQNLNIGSSVNGIIEQTNNNIIEKYCYSDLETNCDIYGGLYEWNEMMQYVTTPGVQGICLTGWHIPTDAEWCTLTLYLEPTVNCNAVAASAIIAGGKLKEDGTSHWTSPNTGATNESGFTALPGGFRSGVGAFNNINKEAHLYSSSEYSATQTWKRFMTYSASTLSRNSNSKQNGFSVRCVKN